MAGWFEATRSVEAKKKTGAPDAHSATLTFTPASPCSRMGHYQHKYRPETSRYVHDMGLRGW